MIYISWVNKNYYEELNQNELMSIYMKRVVLHGLLFVAVFVHYLHSDELSDGMFTFCMAIIARDGIASSSLT